MRQQSTVGAGAVTGIEAALPSTSQPLWFAFLASVVIFLLHKMEGRFPGSPPTLDRYPDWHRQMPGLLVSHEPFDTLLNMGLTFALQLALAIGLLWLLRRALLRLDQQGSAPLARGFVLCFSAAWVGLGCFETHHILKLLVEHAYVPGSLFATLFVLWIFLALLPLALYRLFGAASSGAQMRVLQRGQERR